MLFSERRDAGHVGRFSLGVATLVGRVDAQAPASPRRTTKSSPLQSFVASRCPRARFVALRAATSPCCSRAHVKGSCIGKLTRFSWRYCARGIPTESASTISRKLHITRAVVHPLRIIRSGGVRNVRLCLKDSHRYGKRSRYPIPISLVVPQTSLDVLNFLSGKPARDRQVLDRIPKVLTISADDVGPLRHSRQDWFGNARIVHKHLQEHGSSLGRYPPGGADQANQKMDVHSAGPASSMEWAA